MAHKDSLGNGGAGTKNIDTVVEPTVHLIVFKLGNEDFAIRIEQVKEVNITPEITRMPQTSDFIKGVANIRGDIIAIMDLEERFMLPVSDMQPKGSKNTTYTLVIESGNFNIGILVRDVPQSLSVPVSKIDKTPGIIQAMNINESYISGIAKHEGKLVIILDIQKILSFEELEQLQV
jgi:purine-binding chemotaxis protein CheW